jgi:hypothetical protein
LKKYDQLSLVTVDVLTLLLGEQHQAHDSANTMELCSRTQLLAAGSSLATPMAVSFPCCPT